MSPTNNVVGVAAALAGGIFLGGIVGYVAHATFTEPEVVVPPVEYIEKEITDEDLARLCETLTTDEKVKVVEAWRTVAPRGHDEVGGHTPRRTAPSEGRRMGGPST